MKMLLLLLGAGAGLCVLGIYLYSELSCRARSKQGAPFFCPVPLLFGDLHCHSTYSEDGVFSVDKILGYAKGAGFDFVAVTDHNAIGAVTQQQEREGILLVPGCECSLTESCGHFHVLGIRDIELAPDMTQKQEIVEYMNRMKARGARIQLNHPFNGGLGWHVGWDVPFDYFEVWNRQYNQRNAAAIDWWHQQLCTGRRITATGGTDSHTTKCERYPINAIYCEKHSPEGIIAALDAGRSFITECSYGPWIQLKIGEQYIGDEVPLTSGELLEVFVEHIKPGYRIKVLSDKGVELDAVATGGNYRAQVQQLQGRRFFRCEVWRTETTLAALSNPIYIMNSKQ